SLFRPGGPQPVALRWILGHAAEGRSDPLATELLAGWWLGAYRGGPGHDPARRPLRECHRQSIPDPEGPRDAGRALLVPGPGAHRGGRAPGEDRDGAERDLPESDGRCSRARLDLRVGWRGGNHRPARGVRPGPSPAVERIPPELIQPRGHGMLRMLRHGTLLALILLVAVGCARSPEAKKARHLERGDRYYKQEQYREAGIEYRNAVRIDANSAQANRQLGLVYYHLGEYAQAFRFLLKGQELEPENLEVRLKIGQIYLLGGRVEEARREALRALEKDANNLDALILIAGAARSKEDLAAAIRQLEAARSAADTQAKLHLALAGLYLRTGDQVAAERELRAAIAREPKSVEAHGALASFYVAKGDRTQAEQELKAAAEYAPSGSRARVRLADFYLLTGRQEEAKQLLREITQKASDNFAAWRLLAEIALAEGKLDEAEKAIE